jgi:ABC-type transporter Mla MlaB component
LPALPLLPALDDGELPPPAAPAPVQMSRGLPPLAPLAPASFASGPAASGDFGDPFAVEVSEVAHDPELDEAVIAFANADFQQCEATLQRLTGPDGERAQHAETWLVLFDLYRATGQQQRFESLAIDYAHQFGWSAPQWYSLPKLVAETIAEVPALGGAASARAGEVGWVAPERLDLEAVSRLRSQTLQLPLPWVFDFGRLRSIDAEAAMQLSTLFRLWAGQQLEMRWVAGNRLFQVLSEAAPTGVRDADPALWLTRLDALRLANRADQFDEAAIDYCVTYEVSPPSWEPARCKVHIAGSSTSTRPPPLSVVSEVSTSFFESGLHDEPAIEVAQLELSGQLVGDIVPTLARLQDDLGSAPIVQVSCARLIRVDFLAAGDLLNWVLARRKENRSVQFADAHRLVALFFGAMGINEHAKVQVRKV